MKPLEDFTITKETLKEVCDYAKKHFTPKSIFNVVIVLPFYVPFPEGAETAKVVPEGGHLAFMQFKKMDYLTECITTEFANSLTINCVPDKVKTVSLVEIAFVSIEDFTDREVEERLTGPVMNALITHLNKTLIAFSFLSYNTGVYPISRNMLPYAAIGRVLDCLNFDVVRVSPIAVNTSYEADMMLKAMKIDDDQVREVLAYESELTSRFKTSESFAFDALRHFRNGLLKESVISINTAVESFLFSLFIEFKIVDGADDESAKKSATKMALANLLKDEPHLKSRIGGVWNTSGEASDCANWHTSAYLLRNRIVHSGYEPDSPEAYNALKAALDFREYVFNLMRSHTGTYQAIGEKLSRFYKHSKQTFASTVFETDLSYNDEKRMQVMSKSMDLAYELIRKQNESEKS